jgi:hypothetical protein
MATGPTASDQELAQAATALAGLPITPAQIERWREGGYLPRDKFGRGKGKGWRYEWRPDSVEHAACLARAVAELRTLDAAALVCFMRLHSPRAATLKRAFKNTYRHLGIRPELDLRGESDAVIWARASQEAKHASRRAARFPFVQEIQKRIGGRTDVVGVLTNWIAVSMGATPYLAPEAVAAIGMTPEMLAAGKAPRGQSDPTPFELADIVETASAVELERARDEVVQVFSPMLSLMLNLAVESFGITIPDFLPQEEPSSLLFEALAWVPMRIRVRERLGDKKYEETLRTLKEGLDRGEVQAEIEKLGTPNDMSG